MEQEKPLSTMYYGVAGIAAVGAITLTLLGIVMISTPRDQLTMLTAEHLVPGPEQN